MKSLLIFLLAIASPLTLSCVAAAEDVDFDAAIYLGVSNYGGVDVDDAAAFTYRFSCHGEERAYPMWNGEPDENGDYPFPLQNRLKVGRRYSLTIEDGVITDLRERGGRTTDYVPPVSGTPGERTVKNLLSTALMPVGRCLYVYGGGWNWQDNDGGEATRTIGLSPAWMRFFARQDGSYTYRDRDGDSANKDPANSYYPYGRFNQYGYAGLDCSGYIGWTLYNTFESESGRGGWVNKSTSFARGLAKQGLGEWSNEVTAPDGKDKNDLLPGDIISLKGHVWMVLGTCEDGSVVMLHSSPTRSYDGQPGGGVQLGAIGPDYNCEALVLAETYNTRYFSDWHERYPVPLLPYERYIPGTDSEETGRFTWDVQAEGGLTDPEGVRSLRPAELLALLFGETAEESAEAQGAEGAEESKLVNQ